MIVYVVICDTPRTDLDNVDSSFFDKQNAIDRMELLNIEDTWNTWHIEKLEVE